MGTAADVQLAEGETELLHIVRHLLGSQDDDPALADPALEYWIQPSGSLCGDMLIAARAPSGALHILLVDAGHHGLAAYLSLLPLIAPFRRMTEKGFPPAAIARELNVKVRQALPTNWHLAAILAAVEAREGVISVWNGGMPGAFMLDGFGRYFKQFLLQHPPLGALDNTAFVDAVEQHAFTRGEQLVMVSDGLLAACNPEGKSFGMRGLSDTLTGLPRSQRRAEVVATLESYLAGHAPEDDMSLVLVDCEKALANQTLSQQSEMRIHQPGNWSFRLQLDANELPHLDVVPLLLGVTAQFPLTQGRSGELFVILSELFNNALDHGVLQLDSCLKLSPDGMETWLQQREARLAALQEGEISLNIEQRVDAQRIALHITCRDSGPGFDLQAMLERGRVHLSSTTSHNLPFGRGLALMQGIVRDIEISGRDSEVTVSMPLMLS